ncbi:MAG: hypothetical protein GC181_13160 [Bacteroidetes bacterium]|nr:hypothetical protein [Bacteroidota bacterium]
MSIDRIIRYVYYIIISILAIVGLAIIFRSDAALPKVDLSLWQGIIYSIIAAGITLVFALLNMVLNFRGSIKAIIGVVAMGLIYLIGKGLASTELPQKMADEGITVGTLTASEAGVFVSVVLIGIALLITIASGIRGFFQ